MEIKKASVAVTVLLMWALSLAGCNTAKGAAKGTVAGVGVAVGSTAKGAVQDVKATGNCIKKTDEWIKKNLW